MAVPSYTPPLPALHLQVLINASVFYSDLFQTHEKYIVRIIGRSHSTDHQNKLYIISSRYKVDKAYVFYRFPVWHHRQGIITGFLATSPQVSQIRIETTFLLDNMHNREL